MKITAALKSVNVINDSVMLEHLHRRAQNLPETAQAASLRLEVQSFEVEGTNYDEYETDGDREYNNVTLEVVIGVAEVTTNSADVYFYDGTCLPLADLTQAYTLDLEVDNLDYYTKDHKGSGQVMRTSIYGRIIHFIRSDVNLLTAYVEPKRTPKPSLKTRA